MISQKPLFETKHYPQNKGTMQQSSIQTISLVGSVDTGTSRVE